MGNDFGEEDDTESLELALANREFEFSVVMAAAQEQETRVLMHLMQLLGYHGTLDACDMVQAKNLKTAYQKAMKKAVYDSVVSDEKLTTGKQIADALIAAASAE